MTVSVVMITYGHEMFIEEAINGVLMQDCSFPIELIIADDQSPDGTAAVVKRCSQNHPKGHLIKYLVRSKNLGMIENFRTALKDVKGKYIALCEGDDYWTDPSKLQRQVDFLELNIGYGMVSENGIVLNTTKNTQYNFSVKGERDIQLSDLLDKRSFPTASVMFRTHFLDEKFFALTQLGDTILWCYLITKGKIKYFPNVSSVYRRGIQGIVESSDRLEWANLMENWNGEISNFLPPGFDKKILKRRNYDEFLKALLHSSANKQFRAAFAAFIKCFKYQPLRAIKALTKIM
ncbi:MAG: glycosyltransferase [Bacteroidota bacterium]